MDNAIKYTDTRGSIKINISLGTRQRCLVCDTGIEFPEHQPHVFERFTGRQSHSKSTGGTGLGLSIVKMVRPYMMLILNLRGRERNLYTLVVQVNRKWISSRSADPFCISGQNLYISGKAIFCLRFANISLCAENLQLKHEGEEEPVVFR